MVLTHAKIIIILQLTKANIKNINADYLISALTVLENSSPHLMVYALNNIYASSFDF